MGLFGSNKKALKKWPQLSPEDADLCWKVLKCPVGEEDKYLSVAIREKRYEVLAANPCAISSQGVVALSAMAYELQDDRALILVGKMSARGWGEAEQTLLLNTFTARAAWPEGDKLFFPWLHKLDAGKLVEIIARHQAPEVISALMKQLYTVRPKDGASIVIGALKFQGAVLDAALDMLPIDTDTPSVLAHVGLTLLKAKETTNDDIFDALLARGMNVNHDKGALLTAALKNNRIAEAQKLIDARFNLELLGEGVREVIYSESGQPDAIEFIERYVGKRIDPTKAISGFVLTAPDTVVRSIPLPEGGSLTIAFNFTLRQQIVIAQRAEANTPASAPTMIPFDMLGGLDALHAATDALRALDGDVSLVDLPPRASPRIVLGKQGIKNNV